MVVNFNNNDSAFSALNNLTKTQQLLDNTNIKKISTGYRIEMPKDDQNSAFKLSQSLDNMTETQKRAREMQSIQKATQDTMTVLQTASGGLDQTSETLNQMTSIASQSMNESLDTNERNGLQDQFNKLKKNLDNISNGTTFNSYKLLDGSLELATVSGKDGTRSVKLGDASSKGLGLDESSVTSKESAMQALDQIKKATEAVANDRKKINEEGTAVSKDLQEKTKEFLENPMSSENTNESQAELRTSRILEDLQKMMQRDNTMLNQLQQLKAPNVLKLLQ